MSDHEPLENVLVSTLNRAAADAPPPPADLYRTVTRRHARRRNGLVAAAIAVVMLLAGMVTVTRPEPTPVATTPATAEDLWPDAVRTLPTRLGNAEYTVDALLANGRTVVHSRDWMGLSTILVIEPPGSPLPYRAIVGYGHGQTPELGIGEVAANDKWLVWRVTRRGNTSEIWSLPWGEDQPRKIAETGALDTFSLALDGDRVIYGPSQVGMRSVPAAGGASTTFPGTGGRYWRMRWPWIVVGPGMNRAPDAPTELWNLRTGQRRTAKFVPAGYRDACGAVWCLTSDQLGKHLATVRVDGSGRRTWPGYSTNQLALTPLLDRYLPLDRPDGLDLVDVETGRIVVIRPVRIADVPPTFLDVGSYHVGWIAGGQKKVLDLRRLP